ncbi:hypothetical protein PG985_014662 [Apiospora marii]|uniref:DUF6546 domain-containing protein n=1 Tax=Apiospora marii TaxID=335849 RepID=A0ABR1R4N1_9PEZI
MDNVLAVAAPRQVPLWDRLPREIRMMVFGFLGSKNLFDNARWSLFTYKDNGDEDFINPQSIATSADPDRYATFASVSREWQGYFEEITFQALVLSPDRVNRLESLVSFCPRRLSVLRYIHLRIDLSEYDCRTCDKAETRSERTTNNQKFTSSIVRLFDIMKHWPAIQGQGIRLELSAHSPSDYEHRFKRLEYHRHNECYGHHAQPDRLQWLYELEDMRHGWVPRKVDVQQIVPRAAPIGASMRVFGSGLSLEMDSLDLPSVPRVDTFAIRRQSRRAIKAIGGLNIILEALPNLIRFSYETWHGINRQNCLRRDRELKALMGCVLAHENLESVWIFKNFENQTSHNYNQKRGVMPRSDPSLGQFLAESSRNIEFLRLSFVTDAMDFFQAFWLSQPALPPPSEMRWHKLVLLVMTCGDLREDGRPETVIETAARAAMNMPKLTMMSIWNCGKGHGAFMEYARCWEDRITPSLTIGSTWDHELSHESRTLWQQVADLHQCRSFEFQHMKLKAKRMTCYTSLANPYRQRQMYIPDVGGLSSRMEMNFEERVKWR